jgi:hypothetical protein
LSRSKKKVNSFSCWPQLSEAPSKKTDAHFPIGLIVFF